METTAEVVRSLRAEGFNVRRSYVGFLVRDNWTPAPERRGRDHLWDDVHVEALKRELRRRGRCRGGDNG